MKTFFVLLLMMCGSMPLQAKEPPAKPVENRFLFVVENSLAMKRSAAAAQKTVRELIESGVQGQMRPGDTFGLWTFNDRLDTGFPLQRWLPSESKKLAETASDFLIKRRNEKKALMQSVLPPLFSVMKSSQAITVLFISTGQESIQGTPFDSEINAIYPSYVRELREAKLPFVTVFVGRNGLIVAHAVNSALGPIQIPNPPIQPEAVLSKTKTNVPVVKGTTAVTKPAVTNQPSTNVAIVKNDAVAALVEKTNVASDVPSNAKSEVAASATETNSKISPELKTTEPQPLTNPNSLLISEPTQKIAVAENLPAKVPSQIAGEIVPEKTATNSNSLAVVAPEILTNAQKKKPAQIPPVVATQPIANRKRFVLAGGSLLIIAGILIFLVVRNMRGKSQPSIISKSMDHRK